jgi:protein phosphatase
VTASLVVLVLLLGGGAYGAWWYNQQQLYVGVQNGYVAIFRGTDQSLAGISLSSLLTRSTLEVGQLRLTDQNTISGTISQGSVTQAESLITGLQSQRDQCLAQWTALAAWQAKDGRYVSEVAAAARAKPKGKVPAKDNPGPMPATPDAADCAQAAAFGIPAAALPSAQGSTATTTPTPTPTPSASPSAKPSASSKTSPTPRTTT